MKSLSVIQTMLLMLEEAGVTHLFGVPGGPLVPLYEALADRKRIRPILVKHEEGAAFMAEGYAMVRRSLGVCFGTSGPGATNALTGVASAYSDSIPVLFFSAQVASTAFGRGALQDSSGGHWTLNSVELFRSVTKSSLMLQSAQQISHMMRSVLRAALTGRQGAVHLTIPADLMTHAVSVDLQPLAASCSPVKTAGHPQAIAQAARQLCNARCPVLFVGHGVNLAGAWQPLRQIAETLKIPVATTLKGKGAFPELHELSLGVFGLGGSPFSDAYVLSSEIDMIVFVGTSLGEFQTHGWEPGLARNRTVIQIDVDPQEIGKNYPVDIAIVGDANNVLSELAKRIRLEGLSGFSHTGWLLNSIQAKYSRFYDAQALQGDHQILKPQAVIARMNEILPTTTLLFVDSGNCFSWVGQYYVARETGTIFMSTNMASMGFAVAAAIGGKIAAPERPVVAVLGDGAFAMNGMEMHTAAEYGIPVIWVVLNNGGHGMVYNGENLLCGQSFSTIFRHPLDITAIARGLGIRSYRVTNLDELSLYLAHALTVKGPCVIDALVDIEEVPYALKRRVETLHTFFGSQECPATEKDVVQKLHSHALS